MEETPVDFVLVQGSGSIHVVRAGWKPERKLSQGPSDVMWSPKWGMQR